MAQVARYHRKALPKEKHELFATLDEEGRRTVQWLGGILRVADGLDVRHAGAVRDVACRVFEGRVVIECRITSPDGPELAAAARKSDLLQQILGFPVAFDTKAT